MVSGSGLTGVEFRVYRVPGLGFQGFRFRSLGLSAFGASKFSGVGLRMLGSP